MLCRSYLRRFCAACFCTARSVCDEHTCLRLLDATARDRPIAITRTPLSYQLQSAMHTCHPVSCVGMADRTFPTPILPCACCPFGLVASATRMSSGGVHTFNYDRPDSLKACAAFNILAVFVMWCNDPRDHGQRWQGTTTLGTSCTSCGPCTTCHTTRL